MTDVDIHDDVPTRVASTVLACNVGGTAYVTRSFETTNFTALAFSHYARFDGTDWENRTIAQVQADIVGADLTAIEALATTGILARTAPNTWLHRSIDVADAKLTVSNGDGVAGDPTLGFGSVSITDLSTYGTTSGTGSVAMLGTISGEANDDVLQWTGATWENQTKVEADIAIASRTLDINSGGGTITIDLAGPLDLTADRAWDIRIADDVVLPPNDSATLGFTWPIRTVTGDPAIVDGRAYYNSQDNVFRVCENGAWFDITGSGVEINNLETDCADIEADEIVVGTGPTGTAIYAKISTLPVEVSPQALDLVLIELADGTLAHADVDDLPGGGGGLNNIVEDVTPQLGAMLDVNTFGLGDGTLELLTFTEVALAENNIKITNAAGGNSPIIGVDVDSVELDEDIGIRLVDSEETELLQLTSVIGPAINYLEITNAATGLAGPILRPSADGGTSPNVHLNLESKGTGIVNINGEELLVPILTAAADGDLLVYDTTPNPDTFVNLSPGTTSQLLQFDGSTLAWTSTPRIASGSSIDDADGDPYITFVEHVTPQQSLQITQGNVNAPVVLAAIGQANSPLTIETPGTGTLFLDAGGNLEYQVAALDIVRFPTDAAGAGEVLTVSSTGPPVILEWAAPGGGSAHNMLSTTHTDSVTDTIAAGDILIANSTPLWSALPIADDDDVLTLVSGLPVWQAPSGGSAHLFLSATHTDTVGSAAVRGGLAVVRTAVATPEWTQLAISASAGDVLRTDGTDAAWATLAAADLSNGTTGTGAVVLDTSPTLDASLILNTGANDYTLTWDALGAARAISIPDPGGTDVFLFEAATQTITGKTIADFSNDVSANDIHAQLRNQSGAAMTMGDAVFISGYSVGEEIALVGLANASVAGTMPCVAILNQATLANNATGDFVEVGTVPGVDTSAWTAGDEIWVSETGTTTNTLTNAKPTGAALIQKVAVVLRSHATLGILEVFGAGRANDLPNIAQDNVWVGDGSGVPTALALTTAGAVSYNGTAFSQAGIQDLSAVSGTGTTAVGVTIASIGIGEMLEWTGSNWINQTKVEADIALASRTLTVAGTADEISSSAGAQDLTANRTWTLGLADDVVFPTLEDATMGIVLPIKTDTGDPATGIEGRMYYNTFDNKFRVFEEATWKDITGGGSELNNLETICTDITDHEVFVGDSGGAGSGTYIALSNSGTDVRAQAFNGTVFSHAAAADLSDGIPNTRTVGTAAGSALAGGGALSGNLALDVDIAAGTSDEATPGSSDWLLWEDNAGGVLHRVQITNLPAGAGNTLDGAYDQGGNGAGRTIEVTDSPVLFRDTATLAGSSILEVHNTQTSGVITNNASDVAEFHSTRGNAEGGSITDDHNTVEIRRVGVNSGAGALTMDGSALRLVLQMTEGSGTATNNAAALEIRHETVGGVDNTNTDLIRAYSDLTDAEARFEVTLAGDIRFGPGSATVPDTILARSGVGILDLTDILNVGVGIQVAGAADSGNVLRGNATNFVSATLAAADLSDGVTGSDAVVLATSPTLTTPIIADGGSITDAGGDPYLTFAEVATPVNDFQMAQGLTTAPCILSAIGEAAAGMRLTGTGAGTVEIINPEVSATGWISANHTHAGGTTGGLVTWADLNKTVSSIADITTAAISDTTGTLLEGRGGTGQTTWTQGDIVHASATDDLSGLGIGTADQVLRTNGAGTLPEWYTPVLTKDFDLENPTTAADFRLFRTPVDITITELVVTIVGTGTPSCTVDLRHHLSRNNAGTALITSPTASTEAGNSAESTGHVITSFDDAALAAGEHLWLEIDAVTTTDVVELTVSYTVD